MELKGHSGCKIQLLKNGSLFVRKTSKDIDYNYRLIEQCKKQKAFTSKYAKTPMVFRDALDSLYSFDMEYIRGESVASFLLKCPVNQLTDISNMLIGIIKENRFPQSTGRSKNIIEKKIHSLNINHQAMDFLSKHNWKGIKKSMCHGDLTFENILYDGSNFYLIDFLDTFYETWIADVSKIFQDLIVGWSFRNINITENLRLRMLLLNRYFSYELNKFLTKRDWSNIYAYLLLDLLRIIPYAKDKKTKKFVLDSLNSLLKIRGGIYEYVNNSCMWSINTFSRS